MNRKVQDRLSPTELTLIWVDRSFLVLVLMLGYLALAGGGCR